MRRKGRKKFSDLVLENKEALLKDDYALEMIEKKIEEKHMKKIG